MTAHPIGKNIGSGGSLIRLTRSPALEPFFFKVPDVSGMW